MVILLCPAAGNVNVADGESKLPVCATRHPWLTRRVARPAKSQWDFGELFSPGETRRVLTVAELTGNVRRLLEKEVGAVWVTGEITNLRAQSSGHIYFSLKDSAAQLQCVCFRDAARGTRELLQDGQKVVLHGDVTVYEARGQYQLIVQEVELQGVGALQVALEKLKQKLKAEGLFAVERKRRLRRFPQRIGVVTSPTGAALQDVLHVVQRRHPLLELILAPCRVQGQGAAEEIAAAIRLLNEFNGAAAEHDGRKIDLILVTRGGGSLEDLWAFNEEVVARAIFESQLPVVSAVGHEIDFTIADFVADVRAATPSAAAEIITEAAFASRQLVAETEKYLRTMVEQRLAAARAGWQSLTQRLVRAHPRRRLNEQLQRLDDLQTALARCARQGLRSEAVRGRDLGRRLREAARHGLQNEKLRLTGAEARLRLLSPENVLARGFSITTDAATGRVIRAAQEVGAGQKLQTRLKSGEVRSVVEG